MRGVFGEKDGNNQRKRWDRGDKKANSRKQTERKQQCDEKRNKNREIVHKKRLVHNISKPRALFFNKEGQLFNKRDEGDIIIDVGFVKGYKSGVQR